MEIRNKIFDRFLSQGVTEDYFRHQKNSFFRCREQAPLWINIERMTSDKTGLHILEARISWVFPYMENKPGLQMKEFPDSWEGYIAACEWVDSKRLEFIESLL